MARKVVVLLGPPGSGKGTQAKLVATCCGLPHISTGDMLRAAVAEGSDLGRQVKGIIDGGLLVPDDVMREVVRRRISGPDCRDGLLLDGYPRTLGQAKDLEGILGDDSRYVTVILIRVSEETIRRRLVGRRSCSSCGKVFNIYENPSTQGLRCDACGGELVQRPDDREDVVIGRLQVYSQQTEPLVLYYKGLGQLYGMDGEREVEAIHRHIVGILNSI